MGDIKVDVDTLIRGCGTGGFMYGVRGTLGGNSVFTHWFATSNQWVSAITTAVISGSIWESWAANEFASFWSSQDSDTKETLRITFVEHNTRCC